MYIPVYDQLRDHAPYIAGRLRVEMISPSWHVAFDVKVAPVRATNDANGTIRLTRDSVRPLAICKLGSLKLPSPLPDSAPLPRGALDDDKTLFVHNILQIVGLDRRLLHLRSFDRRLATGAMTITGGSACLARAYDRLCSSVDRQTFKLDL